MPKLTDRPTRATLVHSTVARLVATEGVGAATVRRVAEEADISPSALRHMWPTQEALHLSTVKWLGSQQDARWPRWMSRDDATTYVHEFLSATLPRDEAARVEAQSYAEFRATAPAGSVMAEIFVSRERIRVRMVERAVEFARREAATEPQPARVYLPEDIKAAHPDLLDQPSLHLLALAVGLETLIAGRALPLDPDVAVRWVKSLELRHLDLAA